ncbi:MAG: bifunctional oligoribonuclease/PAP phosphatase NrnA [Clostridia bacterium]|nr:bifunctional oligoribonuclease/PAP phosphatase NrnA [Clostridia bacterium]
MNDLQRIMEVILQTKEVAIFSHYHPDGDTLGSQIALALGLEQKGINTKMINKDPFPSTFKFLADWQRIKPLEQFFELPDTLIFLDCATLERSGYADSSLYRGKLTINIDHHISNDNFANLNWVDSTAAATSELIYDLLGLLQVKIDSEIATALYTGISTDTGSFLYENTTPTTHRVAADLINRGADVNALRKNYYESVSTGKLQLLKFALNNLCFTCNNQVVWIIIDEKTFQEAEATDADAEGLINYLKNIAGIEVAMVFRIYPDQRTKVSFRSKNWFDVNKIASLFGGGGHPRAAGCLLNSNLGESVSKVIKVVEESFLTKT